MVLKERYLFVISKIILFYSLNKYHSSRGTSLTLLNCSADLSIFSHLKVNKLQFVYSSQFRAQISSIQRYDDLMSFPFQIWNSERFISLSLYSFRYLLIYYSCHDEPLSCIQIDVNAHVLVDTIIENIEIKPKFGEFLFYFCKNQFIEVFEFEDNLIFIRNESSDSRERKSAIS